MYNRYLIEHYKHLGTSALVGALCCFLSVNVHAADPRFYNYPSRSDEGDDAKINAADAAGYSTNPTRLPPTEKLLDKSPPKFVANKPLPSTEIIEGKTIIAQPAKLELPIPAPVIVKASNIPKAIIVTPDAAPQNIPQNVIVTTNNNIIPKTLIAPADNKQPPSVVPIVPIPATLPAVAEPVIVPPPLPIADVAVAQSKTPLVMMPATAMPLPDATPLSPESKRIADALPPEKTKSAVKKPPITLTHQRKNPLEDNVEVKQHDGIGMSIKVKRSKPNINNMLENAYDALIAGNQEEAIIIYKNVLEEQPNNKLALFGLATTYHRAGQIQLARPLYGKLLSIDPHNVEGLNNFLVLLADESPQEALTELGELRRSHPTFSPVPAQMAAIYEKTGNYSSAADLMKQAIDLSPENLKYRYNMAIILDKKGEWAEAADFYRQLLVANERGEKIPTNSEEIQKRLTFISSNKPKA
jgi:Tfp pilus assembly protein PilF